MSFKPRLRRSWTSLLVLSTPTKKSSLEVCFLSQLLSRSSGAKKSLELISNASDALEKVRHLMVTSKDVCEPDLPLEIRISVDEKKKTFTIQVWTLIEGG